MLESVSILALYILNNSLACIFESILNFIFNSNITKYEVIENYLDIENQLKKAKQIIRILNNLETVKISETPIDVIDDFISIAKLIQPNAENINAINILKLVLKNKKILDKFRPAESNQVQIMTLHKSKGLEFKVVFHLDLYEYTFPSKYKGKYTSLLQDLNLHYVGITRAKECCILCTSTVRHNSNGLIIGGKSEFLKLNRLVALRDIFMY